MPTGLGGRVCAGGRGRDSVDGTHRAHAHDRPATALSHLGHGGLRDVKSGPQDGVQRLFEVLLALFLEWLDPEDAGAVDQHVYPAKALVSRGDEGFGRLPPARVAREEFYSLARRVQLLLRRIQDLLPATVHDDRSEDTRLNSSHVAIS